MNTIKEINLSVVTAVVALVSLVAALIAYLSGNYDAAMPFLKWVLFAGLIPLWFEIVRDMVRGRFGVDLIAGVALVASFIFDQYLAGVVVLLMLSGGQSLEAYALRRARRDLSALLSRAPQTAHLREGGELRDIPVDSVAVDSIVVVKAGEIVPLDGVVMEGETFVDEATLTGESIPVEKSAGALVYSGTINKNGTISVRTTKTAGDSSYNKIVELVRSAESERAPLVRLADRYSVVFTAITFALALGAWLFTHDTMRILAVLVVATPCPLILATPIALISGMSRASARGVIVKGGGALENLASARTFIFDKTGTVTLGTPDVDSVFSYKGTDDSVLSIAASLDQLSAHVLAQSLVAHAKARKVALETPSGFKEDFGNGVRGTIGGKEYVFGKLAFVSRFAKDIPLDVEHTLAAYRDEGKAIVYLADAQHLLGYVVFRDRIRTDSRALFDGLKNDGVSRVALLSGDRKHVAEHVAAQIGIREVFAESLPDDKLRIIRDIPKSDRPVVMVGDGINDAPALAAADVGIALGSFGKTATSESADIVILNSKVGRVREVFHIARATIGIARQGIYIGMGLSIVAMVFAAFGYIRPVYGALIQEGIDVLVILNALRVSRAVRRVSRA